MRTLKSSIEVHLQEAVDANDAGSAGRPEQGPQTDLAVATMMRNLIDRLPREMGSSEGPNQELQSACENIVASLDMTISHLEQLKSAGGVDRNELFNAGHSHDPGFSDELKKRFLGTSDLDEAPHAVVGAKAGISSVVNRDTSKEHAGDAGTQKDAGVSAPADLPHAAHDSPTRLQAFQSHSVPHSSGELATDLALSGVIGAAGFMAATAGRGERKEATHEKKDALHLRETLENEKEQLEAVIDRQVNGAPPVFSTELLKKELLIVKSQLDSVNYTLDHVGKKKQVGVGSELAGWQMMLKGVIDGICKPVAYSGTGGAQVTDIAASVSGFATTVLSPGAAASGLWMGINAKLFFKAERDNWKELLATAVKQSGLQPDKLPEAIRDDFSRVFTEGKWASNSDRLKSVNRLLNWFVGGMSGYAGAMTGLSIHNLVQPVVAGAVIADLVMSAGVVTATGAVLVGTLAFLKHHAKFHDYEHWLEEGHPDVDLDLLREMAASGSQEIGNHAVDTLRFFEGKDTRRQKFLHGLADKIELRYDKLTTHSTDSDAVRQEINQLKEASRRDASKRLQAVKARGRQYGTYVARSAQQLATAGQWRDAYQSARKSVAENSGDGHHDHGHHHGRSGTDDDTSSHNKGRLSALKSGVRYAFTPLRKGARIAGKTVSNTFAPAANDARQAYADNTDRLTEIKLVELLKSSDPDIRTMVKVYLKKEAEENARYAQLRLDTAMNGYKSEAEQANTTTGNDKAGSIAQLPDELKERFRKKGLRLARDKEHHDQAMKLHESIEKLGDDDAAFDRILADAAQLQRWSNPASDSQLDGAERLAKYLWKDGHEEFRKARLCLTTGLLKLAPLIENAPKVPRDNGATPPSWTAVGNRIEGEPPSGDLQDDIGREIPGLLATDPTPA